MLVHAIGKYTPTQSKSLFSKNQSLKTGNLTTKVTQSTPQFGSDIGQGFETAFKIVAVVGGVAVAGAIAAALGFGYWMGKSNTPQTPVQPAPTVQTDNTNPPTK